MLTTISEQSQLLSPKKLLALQRQISIAASPERPGSMKNIGRESSLSYGGNGQISSKHFGPEGDSTYNARHNDNDGDAPVTSNVSNAESPVMDENSPHDGHRTIFSTTSVGNH